MNKKTYICTENKQNEIILVETNNKMTDMIKFTKMHGAGNDYIYVDVTKYPITDPEKLAIRWSAFHTGIGSDGLVLIGTSPIADFSMRIFNADGSEAKMCGNASYCIGKFVYDNRLTDKSTITLDTLSGIKVIHLNVSDRHLVDTATVDMGEPTDIHAVDLTTATPAFPFKGTAVSMGNPHLVIFVDDMSQIDLPFIGPQLENHPLFPGRINVEFAQILSDGQIRMRVWERGSGITMACGTGACATTVAAATTERTGRKNKIIMDGGELTVEWDAQTGRVMMTGTPVKVFEGEISL